MTDQSSAHYNTPEADAAPTPATPPRPRLRSHRRLLRDVLEIILLIVITYTPINLMTARAVVEGPSMQPNFWTGDLVIVNRAAYFFSAPQRGDVIVLHNPRSANSDDLIKRVVGLPGETVEIREGRVYANGTLLEEPYITNFCQCSGVWTLAADEYFILGDNRTNSYDSHNFGPIKRDLIVGQAWIRYWPLPSFTIVQHQNYAPISTNYIYVSPTPTPSRTPDPNATPMPTFSPEDLNPYGGS